MAEREASGDFDYLLDDIADVAETAEPSADPFDPEQVPGRDMTFDAFDENTWYFEPAPPPWYRTGRTLVLLVIAAIAVVALVVSGVLLMFRTPGGPADDNFTPVGPSAQTTAPARSESRSSEPPPPPPRPPVETSAAPAVPPPTATYRPRNRAPSAARAPEIGVTRTPVTRSPISVAPQRPARSQR